MFRASFMKNVPLFARNFGENVALCLLAAGVETSSVAVQKLISLRWRETLTASVHKTYFQNMVRAAHCFAPSKPQEHKLCPASSGHAEAGQPALARDADGQRAQTPLPDHGA